MVKEFKRDITDIKHEKERDIDIQISFLCEIWAGIEPTVPIFTLHAVLPLKHWAKSTL